MRGGGVRGGGGYTTINFLSSANTRFALQGVGEELVNPRRHY